MSGGFLDSGLTEAELYELDKQAFFNDIKETESMLDWCPDATVEIVIECFKYSLEQLKGLYANEEKEYFKHRLKNSINLYEEFIPIYSLKLEKKPKQKLVKI